MTNGLAIPLLLAAALGGQAPIADEKRPPTPAEIAAAIQRLGSSKFTEREEATAYLWRAGRPALAALEAAAVDQDLERAKRALSLLDKVRWGLTPDVDPKIAAVINAFRLAPNIAAKQGVLQELRKQQLLEQIADLLMADSAYAKTTELANNFAREIRAAAVEALATDPARTESILRWRVKHDKANASLHDYAAFLVLTGKQDETEARLRRELKLDPDGDSARLLAQLLIYLGREAEARTIAESTSDDLLQTEIAFRLSDWKTMAEKHPAEPVNNIERLGLALKFATLAGDAAVADRARAAIVEWQKGQRLPTFFAAEVLMLNERWSEAEKILGESQLTQRIEMLCDQMRYREVFENIEPRDEPGWAARWFTKASEDLDANKPETQNHFRYALQIGRALHQTGQLAEAEKLFDEMATWGSRNHPVYFWSPLLEMELRLGRREQAERQAVPLMNDEQARNTVTSHFFKSRSSTAFNWWPVLQTHFPKEEPLATWRRLQAWMKPGEGSPSTDATFDEVLQTAERLAKEADPARRPSCWQAVAEVCRLRNDPVRAAKYFREQIQAVEALGDISRAPNIVPADVAAGISLGDVRYAQKQWLEAAAAYEAAWKRRRFDPLPLYLQGRALVQAGKADEGRALMRRAELLPLADTQLRRELAAGLQERGLVEAAREQRLEVWRLGPRSQWDFNVLSVAETEAKELGRAGIAEAAQYWSYLPFGLFRTSTAMPETLGYRELAQAVHKGRAWAAMDAGKWNEALAELKLAQDARPGYSAFAETAVARLDAAGRQTDADAVFARAFGVYETVCRDFPESAWHHNGAAWLAAQCERRLNDALKHAETAVRLQPDNAAYLDTLAEVHFRRGDATEAVEIEERAVKLAPDDPEIAAQMKKFREATEKKE